LLPSPAGSTKPAQGGWSIKTDPEVVGTSRGVLSDPLRRVFISYRREDTGGHAGRLCDRLREALGARHVFMDVEGISPGEDFTAAIDQRLAETGTLIALIGPRWMGEGSPPRIRRDDDFVRLELAAALRRKIRVIPVLVNGTRLPAAADLPPDIVELTKRNAIRLDDESFDDDARRLILAIKPRSTSRNWWLVAGAAATVALSGLVVHFARSKPPPPARETAPASAPSSVPAPPAGNTAATASAPEPEPPKPDTPKAKKKQPVVLANDPRVRSAKVTPPNDWESLPGPYCYYEKGPDRDWTTGVTNYAKLLRLFCYASLDSCREQAGKYAEYCMEAKLWCYYVWDRDEKGHESGGPYDCSQRRSACESARRRLLNFTPTPVPYRVGRIAVSGECYLLKNGQ
jgi:hypothetical protein